MTFFKLNKHIYILVFFLIFFLTGIFIVSQYGISIDEDKTRIVGFVSLEYIFKIFLPEQAAKINEIIAQKTHATYGMMTTSVGVVTSGITFNLPMAVLELILEIEAKVLQIVDFFGSLYPNLLSILVVKKIINKENGISIKTKFLYCLVFFILSNINFLFIKINKI